MEDQVKWLKMILPSTITSQGSSMKLIINITKTIVLGVGIRSHKCKAHFDELKYNLLSIKY